MTLTRRQIDAARLSRRGSARLESGAPSALADELRRQIRGDVLFDDGSRALYATDSSNYREVPIGVVIPRDVDDVVRTVRICREHAAPVLPRGGGTSLAGQCCNVAVVIDMSKHLDRVIEVDGQRRRARVQPGVIPDELNRIAEEHRLTFAPVPATHGWNTVGGMIGNNSCGIHSVMGGKTDDNVDELEILTYDGHRMRVGPTSEDELDRIIARGGRRGEIYRSLRDLRDRYASQIRERFPRIPRRVSGYGLDQLLPENGFNVARALVGTEGTCATVLEAVVRLVYSPPSRSLLVLGYPDVYQAGDHVPEILEANPTALEGIDHLLIRYMKEKGLHPDDLPLLPDGRGWLLVELGGEDKQESDARARDLMERLKRKGSPPSMRLFDSAEEEADLWEIRESGLGATAHVPGMDNTWPGWEDSAVPPDKVGAYLRDLRDLLGRYHCDCSLYGHFGQGCIHTRIDFDLVTAEGIARFRSFLGDASDLVLKHGGSLSGEHGDGQARAELLPKMYGPELVQAFREFKAIWDPDWKMNPGKVVDPNPIVADLRLGTDYAPRAVNTRFSYVEDRSSFGRAMLRCAGVGKCRRPDGGTMCPSYMVTRAEEHSTRGRARLLFEMMQGETISDGWRSEKVKEALDLCLACKGCKGECPVHVDMATYKAEFLSHYYEGRLRPPSAYAFGLIMYWARLASLAPRVANLFTQTPVVRSVAKALLGVAPQRDLPAFATWTFKDWFRRRHLAPSGGRQVILWADTFNNYFHPETAVAAVEVLEAAGFTVQVPAGDLCCGRPVYDFGMIDLGRHLLRQVLEGLRPQIRAGVPVVGLEPSCVAVFRDELVNLFPNDPDAKRLSRQTHLLSEFLEEQAADFELPKAERRALVHGHCHHKAVMRFDDEDKVLKRLGMDYRVLDSGCCGMAGAFGFEKDHYDVSVAAGERVLLPAVRDATDDELIIADGFSCREQIRQTTSRRAVHLAEVIQMALQDKAGAPAGGSRDGHRAGERAPAVGRRVRAVTATVGLGAILVGAASILRNRRGRR